jgi:hypothetical protein
MKSTFFSKNCRAPLAMKKIAVVQMLLKWILQRQSKILSDSDFLKR